MATTTVLQLTRALENDIAFDADRGRRETVNDLVNLLKAGNVGAKTLTSLKIQDEVAAATGTITLATCAANTVIEINGVRFLALASGTPTIANGEFVISGTDAADATSLVAAINGSTDARIAGVLTASSTGLTGVVTLTPVAAGSPGNAITIKTLGVMATASITAATVADGDTITLNGVTLTADQDRATGTVTAATAIAGDTVTLNGVVLTGVAGAANNLAGKFSIDTGDTETATSLAAVINAHPSFTGILTATSATDVVTIRAVDKGTGGNAITLESSDGVTLAVSAATLEDGSAEANNAFDWTGTNTQVAADIARCINESTTAGVNLHAWAISRAAVVHIFAKAPGTIGNAVSIATSDGATLAITGGLSKLGSGTLTSVEGVQASATITCASAQAADTVTINGVVFTADATTQGADQWEVSGTDTADAASLVLAINNSTSAGAAEVIATNSSGVVTVKARRGGVSGNAITLVSSNGTRLAVTGSGFLASGAAPTTVVPSAERLASGASGTLLTKTF